MAFPGCALALLLHALPVAAADDPGSDTGAFADSTTDSGDSGDSGKDSGDSGKDSGDSGDSGTDSGATVGTPNDSGIPADLGNGIDLGKAQEAPSLTDAQHEFLKPKRSRLPQNPYAQTDFTAYTLEWGEFKIGLANISAGVLPRTQLATVPVLWALGVANGNLKVNAVRFGPVDLAITADLANLGLPRLDFKKFDGGLLASWIITDPWSVHVAASYGRVLLDGEPDLSRLSPLFAIIGSTSNSTLDNFYQNLLKELNTNKVELGFSSTTLAGQVATDIRFNRRDSLIIEGTAILSRNVDLGATVNGQQVDLDPSPLYIIPGVQQYFSPGARPVTATADVTAAWQFAWKHFDLRLGIGYSKVPLAWIEQSLEFDYRFGGATRHEESRIRKGWRKDKKHIDQADPSSPPE